MKGFLRSLAARGRSLAGRRPSLAVGLGATLLLLLVGERGENNRFKYFVEPVLFVLVAVALFEITWARAARRPEAPGSAPRAESAGRAAGSVGRVDG